MKYTMDESLRELSVRSRRLRRKREKGTVKALSAAALVLLAGLVSVVETVAGQTEGGTTTSVFGAFVLPNTAGGYILAGVIAFVLGAAITLLCLRYRKRTSEEPERNSETDDREDNGESVPETDH